MRIRTALLLVGVFALIGVLLARGSFPGGRAPDRPGHRTGVRRARGPGPRALQRPGAVGREQVVVRLLPPERGAHGQQDVRRRHGGGRRRADRAQHPDALGCGFPARVLVGRNGAQPRGEHPGDHRQSDEGPRAVAGHPGRPGGLRAVAPVSAEPQSEGRRVAVGRGSRGGEARVRAVRGEGGVQDLPRAAPLREEGPGGHRLGRQVQGPVAPERLAHGAVLPRRPLPDARADRAGDVGVHAEGRHDREAHGRRHPGPGRVPEIL